MKGYSEVCKLKACGQIDVYQYYNNVDSPCIVTAEDQDGNILTCAKFDNENDFEERLGVFDAYNDTDQGENFLNNYYRNQDPSLYVTNAKDLA